MLPFGNGTIIETLTGAQLVTAFVNGFAPFCNPAVPTGRFPQVSELKVQFHCDGTTPVVDGIWKTPGGISGPHIALAPADTVRLVTNDFMFAGGDGYAVLAAGSAVAEPGDDLQDLVVDFAGPSSQSYDQMSCGRCVEPR